MRHQGHRGVRDMHVERTAEDAGLVATIEVKLYDKGHWYVNGDPCGQSATTAARLVAECLESLEEASQNGGQWLDQRDPERSRRAT